MQQQLAHPFFAKSITQDLDQEPMFVVLSDVHLDQPRVLQQLESLFASYENYSPSRLPLFVLMGNFSSSCREAPPLDELAAVIAPFTNLARNAHFVLVPGPNDSPQQVLPLPPLSSKLPRVAHVHWATNPCRIYYKGREVALFNYNILHMLQRKQILWQEVKRTHDDDGKLDDQHQQMHHRLIKTLLDQAYLLPMQGVPVFWNYDHALRLYPLPDALILGGDALADGFHEIYGGCHVIHAGSMGQSGTYASYRLNDTMEVENASSDTKIQGSVVFEKFGCEHELLG
jgi:DNA polymerase epsilon subunit 2